MPWPAIERRLAENRSLKANLEEMQRYFDLPKLPERIEIYDNSHNQGTYAVGAMVVATPEGFDKKSYGRLITKTRQLPMTTLL